MKYNSAAADAARCRSLSHCTGAGTQLMRIQWSTVVAGHGGFCATRFFRDRQLCSEKNPNSPRLPSSLLEASRNEETLIRGGKETATAMDFVRRARLMITDACLVVGWLTCDLVLDALRNSLPTILQCNGNNICLAETLCGVQFYLRELIAMEILLATFV